jgi:hypothetical protein
MLEDMLELTTGFGANEWGDSLVPLSAWVIRSITTCHHCHEIFTQAQE